MCRAARGNVVLGELCDLPLENVDLLSKGFILRHERLFPWREMMIVLPPIETDLLCLVDRADDEADANGEELDLSKRYFDVACDHEALVEHAIEDIDQPGRPLCSPLKILPHCEGIQRLPNRAENLAASGSRPPKADRFSEHGVEERKRRGSKTAGCRVCPRPTASPLGSLASLCLDDLLLPDA